jgi:hypothetical protein
MAPTADPTTDPWGRTPLTTEGLASQDHPLSLGDFNRDAGGYWRVIRGQKTYYPREWFDAAGTFTGTGTQPGDRAGQDQGFFKKGTRWNWTTGAWENPTNWANVIGLSAAGAVGAGIAAPLIAGALGGGGATTGASVGEALGGGSSYVGADIAGTAAATNAAAAQGALSAGAFGPLAGGYGAATTAAEAVPSALAPVGGGASTAMQILRGATGTGGSMAGPYDWLGPVVNASLNLVGTQQQVNASADAAQKQLEATKYAADAQAKAAAESLAFQRQQAAYDAMMAETNRAANYQQWAAKQQQLGSVGQALGLPARSLPAYVPLPGGPGAPPPGVAPPMPSPAPGQPDGPPDAGPAGGTAAAWWNPQDPQGSLNTLLAGKAPTSQTILALKPQLDAAGIQISPANAEGVTSKVLIPGVGWTRILQGGVKGGQGTGWTYVPQGVGGGIGGGGAVPTTWRQGTPAFGQTDALGSVQQYFLDPTAAPGQLALPRYRPLGAGAVGSYL